MCLEGIKKRNEYTAHWDEIALEMFRMSQGNSRVSHQAVSAVLRIRDRKDLAILSFSKNERKKRRHFCAKKNTKLHIEVERDPC